MSENSTFWICATCGVEHAEAATGTCLICADERQWVPAGGQRWTTLAELSDSGHLGTVTELEPDLFGITVEPRIGIGQQALLVRTAAGNLLWDPNGYLDDPLVARVRELGELIAISASHPHMYGVQVEWSRALGGTPVLVAEADHEWVRRSDPAIELWSGRRELTPGVTLLQLGGHFPGSSVVHWAAGAGGKGVLLISDTIQTNPDRQTVTFMRSYPNRIPLSPGVVEHLIKSVEPLEFDRVYDNLGGTIDTEARAAVRRSAERFIGWTRGEFDQLA